MERATAVAQEQYKSLLAGLQAVCQVKGWTVQQIVFVGRTCGSIHVESFNRNMKTLGVLESKWDPIRKKLVRRLLEEQDKNYGPTSHKREGCGARGRTGVIARAGNTSKGHVCVKIARADRGQLTNSRLSGEHGNWFFFCFFFCFSIIFFGFVKFVKFVIN